MDDFWAPPEGSRHLLDLIERLGWPLTKASYVAAMYWPMIAELPVPTEIEAQVPDSLPGEMPTSLADVMQPIVEGPSAANEARLPESLIEQTQKAYGFSRQEAIEELKKFGA